MAAAEALSALARDSAGERPDSPRAPGASSSCRAAPTPPRPRRRLVGVLGPGAVDRASPQLRPPARFRQGRGDRPRSSAPVSGSSSRWSAPRSVRATSRPRLVRRATRPPSGCARPAGATGSRPGTPGPTSPRRCSTGSRPPPAAERCSGCGPGAVRSSGRCWRSTAIRCGGSSRRPGSPSATTRPTPSRSTPATGSATRSCRCCARSGPRPRRRSPRPRPSSRRRARRSSGSRPRPSPSRVRTPPARSAGMRSRRSTPRSAASRFAASPSERPDAQVPLGRDRGRIRSGDWSTSRRAESSSSAAGWRRRSRADTSASRPGRLPSRRRRLCRCPASAASAAGRCARSSPPSVPAADGPDLAVLDPGALGGSLVVRSWRDGDRMRPLGLGGQQVPPGPLHRPQGAEVAAARASGGHLRWAHRLDRRRRGLRGVRREGRRLGVGRSQGGSGPVR